MRNSTFTRLDANCSSESTLSNHRGGIVEIILGFEKLVFFLPKTYENSLQVQWPFQDI